MYKYENIILIPNYNLANNHQSVLELLLCSSQLKFENLLNMLPWMDFTLLELFKQNSQEPARLVQKGLQGYVSSLNELISEGLSDLVSYINDSDEDERYLLAHYQSRLSLTDLEDRKLDLVESILTWIGKT